MTDVQVEVDPSGYPTDPMAHSADCPTCGCRIVRYPNSWSESGRSVQGTYQRWVSAYDPLWYHSPSGLAACTAVPGGELDVALIRDGSAPVDVCIDLADPAWLEVLEAKIRAIMGPRYDTSTGRRLR